MTAEIQVQNRKRGRGKRDDDPISYFVLSFAIYKKPDIQKSELKSNTSGCDYSYYQHKGYFSLKRIHGKMPIAYFF